MPSFSNRIAKAVVGKSGEFVVIRQSLTSSNIKTAAANLTTAATGRLRIVDIMLNTDATGLAGGTNFVIGRKTANIGATTVISDAVSGLGANASHATANVTSGNQPSVTNNVPTVLEGGDILQYSCTGSNCTGAGIMVVTIVFQKVTDNATIASTGA